MSTTKKEPGVAAMIIVLSVICLVVAALLGIINGITAPLIAENNEKTIQESLQVVMPADSYDKVEFSDESVTIDTGTAVPVLGVYQAGEEGYVVEVNSPNGFGGAIDMMAGINSAGEVTGIAIISQSETSGLGSKDTDPGTHQRHHRIHHYLPRSLRRRERRPCCCGSTGLRRDRA